MPLSVAGGGSTAVPNALGGPSATAVFIGASPSPSPSSSSTPSSTSSTSSSSSPIQVLTGAKTTRIAFEKSSKGETRAQGVEFSTGGLLAERFSAQLAPGGEVVMAAGAVHTPHLLQLSGVGGAASLLEHGIQV